MSGLYNLRERRQPLANHELQSVARRSARELIRLNRQVDAKLGFEQWIVAREIALGHYVDGDRFNYEVMPQRVFCRMADAMIHAWLRDGMVRLESFAFDPAINAADLPDTPHSPYILALHGYDIPAGVPITLGQRAIVFRGFLDSYVHIARYRHCIAIDDPDRFVSCVTDRLEEVLARAGCRIIRLLHAPCVYQWSRVIGTRRGPELKAGSWTDEASLSAHIFPDLGEEWAHPEDAKYFIKPGYGFHDAEFRFVWILDQDFEGQADLQCPDLLPYVSVFADS